MEEFVLALCVFTCSLASQNMHNQAPSAKSGCTSSPARTGIQLQPHLLEGTDVQENFIGGVSCNFGPNGALLDGYYRIIYRSQTKTVDQVDEYVSAWATGHFQQGKYAGYWTTHFFGDSAGLDYCEHYQAGMLDGPFTVYNPDHTVRYQTTFQHGNGVWKSYYHNGKVRVVGSYQNGRMQGVWTTYGTNSQVQERNVYIQGVLQPRRNP